MKLSENLFINRKYNCVNEEIKCSVLNCQNETEYQNNSHIFGVMDVCVAVLLSRSRKQGEILELNKKYIHD